MTITATPKPAEKYKLKAKGFTCEKKGDRFHLIVRGVFHNDYPSFGLVKGAVTRILKREENYTIRNCMCCEVEFPSWGIGNRMCAMCRQQTEGLI